MSNETFESSISSGMHLQLGMFAGSWEGKAKTYFEPGVLADESPIEANISILMEGRFIQINYSGSMQGKPLSGISIYGYHLGTKKLQNSWIDSFHTGTEIMFSEGTISNEKMEVTGTYFAGESEPGWSWRTVLERTGADELNSTAFNITPKGEESIAIEIKFNRIMMIGSGF